MISDPYVRTVRGRLHGNELDLWLALLEAAEPLEDGKLWAQMRYSDLAQSIGLSPERGKKTVQRTVSALQGKGYLGKVTPSRHYPTSFILQVPNPELILAEKEASILEYLTDKDRETFDILVKFLERPRNKDEYDSLKDTAYEWLEERGAVTAEKVADKIAELIMTGYMPGARDRYGWYFDRLLLRPTANNHFLAEANSG